MYNFTSSTEVTCLDFINEPSCRTWKGNRHESVTIHCERILYQFAKQIEQVDGVFLPS
jgi:hypothetical protein